MNRKALACAALTLLVTITACGTNGNGMTTSQQTMAEMWTTLVDLVHRFFQGSLDKIPYAHENRPSFSGDGRPNGSYRWEYDTNVPYTPEAEAVARRVVDELRKDGWTIKVDDRKHMGDLNFRASKAGKPTLSITIPDKAVLPSGTQLTIRGGGSSPCIEDDNPPEPRGYIGPPVVPTS